MKESLVAVGISPNGIDFDAPDDRLANVIFLILTPIDDSSAQLNITSEIPRIFRDHRMTDAALRAKSFTDFLALMRACIQWKSKA
jgi:mannitol/fructose-specific phosphotransferase system IIA component (Ntr-type)